MSTQLVPAIQLFAEVGIDRGTGYRLIREHVIPQGVAVKLGRRVYLHRQRFEEFLRAGGSGYVGGWKRASDDAAA